MPRNLLQAILNDKIIKNLTDANSFDLIEKDKNATLKKVTLKGLPEDVTILCLDNIATNTLFRRGKNSGYYENTRCDYVILTNEEAYFIELKSHRNAPHAKEKECIGKFKASYCLLAYIDEVVKNLYGQEKIFTPRKQYYIVLYQISIPKTTTSCKPLKSIRITNTSPEDFLSIAIKNDGEIQFTRLTSS